MTTESSPAVAAAAKRLKTDAGVLIGTHSGHFHADEALAVHMLRQLPAFAGADLVRTRDPAVLATCHAVVDVGGEYDAARHRYDHHQRGFLATFPGRPTKLSSAGLVFLHFGRAIIAQRLNAVSAATATEDSPEVSMLHAKIYEAFIEALDAHDNGIAVYDPDLVAAAGLTKRFSKSGFGLGAMVGRLNRNWNATVDKTPGTPDDDDAAAAKRDEDGRFLTASRRIGEEFDREVDYYTSAWLPARAVVQAAFAKRRADGRILVFDETGGVPWKDHLYTLEQEAAARQDGEGAAAAAASSRNPVLYVLYREKAEPGAKWRIQCVPESVDSFRSRKPLPEAWRGYRDAELDAIAGIEGCVFVHASGFIGGNTTFEGALAMATKALSA